MSYYYVDLNYLAILVSGKYIVFRQMIKRHNNFLSPSFSFVLLLACYHPLEPNKTEVMPLLNPIQGETFEDKLESIANSLASKSNIIALVGAGISVSSGIPDFRSATGLYNTLDYQVGDGVSRGIDYPIIFELSSS